MRLLEVEQEQVLIGMASLEQVSAAYDLYKGSDVWIALLHCVSSYPLLERDANLRAIGTLKQKFNCPVGYSDHTRGTTVPLFAVASGATIIEKHYKLDESMKCPDAEVSITEFEMKKLVDDIQSLNESLGDGAIGPQEVEKDILQYRRFSELDNIGVS